MQVTETLSEGLKRGFTVVVPGEDIESRRTARLTDLGKTCACPASGPARCRCPSFASATAMPSLRGAGGIGQPGDRKGDLRAQHAPGADAKDRPGHHRYCRRRAAKDLEFKVEFELLPDIACRISARSAWSAARPRCRRSW